MFTVSKKRKIEKLRLDDLLLREGMAGTKQEALALLMSGVVLCNDRPVSKPGDLVPADAVVRLRAGKRKPGQVSRGGTKLEAALASFQIIPEARDCADVGSSTGGFTQVLLEAGAKRVIAIDSAVGELDYRLREDSRVEALEGCSVLTLDELPFPVSLVVIDVSLVPLQTVLERVALWIEGEATVIALLKPQYEASALGYELEKGRVVSEDTRKEILKGFHRWLLEYGEFCLRGACVSPITGGKGNTEYLLWLETGEASSLDSNDFLAAVGLPSSV